MPAPVPIGALRGGELPAYLAWKSGEEPCADEGVTISSYVLFTEAGVAGPTTLLALALLLALAPLDGMRIGLRSWTMSSDSDASSVRSEADSSSKPSSESMPLGWVRRIVGALRADGDIGVIGERSSSDGGSDAVGRDKGAARGEGGRGISQGSVGRG